MRRSAFAWLLGCLLPAAVLAGALAPAAGAAPVHNYLRGDDITGLNQACGAAADSRGNVYVSSSGASQVRIYDPQHALLATISNANGPCGLAVDSKGKLYVSESNTGNVVSYAPDAFPLDASPAYGPPSTVDTSGEAQGISVDRSDDRLYVAEGDHIAVYQDDGTTGQNEVQRVWIFGDATGGSFKLSFEGQQTEALPLQATSAQVQAALAGLSTIGAGNVAVQEADEGPRSYRIAFSHALGSQDLPSLVLDTSALIGGGGQVRSLVEGFSFNGRIADGELSEASGVGAYTYGSGATATHYLFAVDSASDEAKIFSSTDIRTQKLRRTISGPTEAEDFQFGSAGGAIAADPSNGHFYVYDAGHAAVDEFEAGGHFLDQTASPSTLNPTDPAFEDAEPTGLAVVAQQNEVQRLTVAAPGGSFTLEFEGEATAPIMVSNATSGLPTAAEIQAALEGLPAIGVGNVLVHGAYIAGIGTGKYPVVFTGALAGRDVGQLVVKGESLTGGSHTATVATSAQGSGPGRLYVGAGAGANAKLLAFGPLAEPSRAPLPGLSQTLSHLPAAAAVDSYGDVYAANASFIKVFGPDGEQIAVGPEGRGIPAKGIQDLEVDSQGNVYGSAVTEETSGSERKVVLFAPASYPPQDGTQYGAPSTVVTEDMLAGVDGVGIGLNPADDRLFVTSSGRTIELKSAAEGSGIANGDFGPSIAAGDVAVCGSSGEVYFGGSDAITVVDADGEVLARIDGAGSPRDTFLFVGERIAVDQSDCHVLLIYRSRGDEAEELDPSGAFVAGFGGFTEDARWGGIAVDNGEHSPNRGATYVAYDDPAPGTFDLTAFGPLSYGEAPVALSAGAGPFGEGLATLNGTVDPRGSELEGCDFEWGLAGQPYEHLQPCAQTPAQIGAGTEAVSVSVQIALPDPQARYHFRLLAHNQFGEGRGEDVLFGPPEVQALSALPVLYDEATLRARIDPVGVATRYHFEYVSQAEFEASGFAEALSSPEQELGAGEAATTVEAPLTGLAEASSYRFRAVAESEAGSSLGAVRALTTLQRPGAQGCANAEFRSGLSAELPDCRAYELVTPADTGGASQLTSPNLPSFERGFADSMTPPRGAGAGEALGFLTPATLPGFEGAGPNQGYRSSRAPGAHPGSGWSTELISTTFEQASLSNYVGGSPGLRYSFWWFRWLPGTEGTLAEGSYLRTPAGIEPLAQGTLGADLQDPTAPVGLFISADGSHVLFSSKAQLEPEAPPAGIRAIYDRAAGSASATVISTPPPGASAETEAEFETKDAVYIGTSEDGATVAFKLGGKLYAHFEGHSAEVAEGSSSFAAIPAAGGRVFYAVGPANEPAPLLVCELAAGPCAGPGATPPTQIAAEGFFIAIPGQGGPLLFTSEEALTGEEENENCEEPSPGEVECEQAEAGAHNLYLWDGASTHFVAVLDPADFESFAGEGNERLDQWIDAAAAHRPGYQPTRSTPDGAAFAFQSHARLSDYENEGKGEIYRYQPSAPAGSRLLCVSCDPSGAPPSADAVLQGSGFGAVVQETNLIPNLTDDGSRVVFESLDRLLPADANQVRDVYEWRADAVSGCDRPRGCLALISSGQGERPNRLYAMSADGRDIFVHTLERLVGADQPGTVSVYDAREGGGIPEAGAPAPCQGDACQGAGATPPALPPPASTGAGDGEVSHTTPRPPCPKGRRKVRRGSKVRCVRQRHAKKHGKGRAGRERGAGR